MIGWSLQLSFALAVYGAAYGTAGGLGRLTGSEAREPSRPKQYETLDGLRGALAIGVFVHHAAMSYAFNRDGIWQSPPSSFFAMLGDVPIALFFMVTSFLFVNQLLARRGRYDEIGFMISRFWRLCPVYFFVLVLMVGVVFWDSGWVRREPIGGLLAGLLNWMSFTVRGNPNLNGVAHTSLILGGVTWTLRYEWLFYLAVPVLGVVIGGGRRWWAGLIFLASILGYWFEARQGDPIKGYILRCFAGGIVAAFWVRSPRLTRISAGLWSGALGIVCLGWVLFASRHAYNRTGLVLLTVFFIAVVSDNKILAIGRSAPARRIGRISYSLYLLHGVVLWVVCRHLLSPTDWPAMDRAEFAGIALGLSIVITLLASATYALIERPGIHWGKRMTEEWNKRRVWLAARRPVRI